MAESNDTPNLENIPPNNCLHIGLPLFINKLASYMEEMVKAGSANRSGMQTADKGRLRSYLKALTSVVEYLKTTQALDMPRTKPKLYEMDAMPKLVKTSSDLINHVLRLLEGMYNEMATSQTARQAAGVHPADETRFKAIAGDIENFIANYVEKQEPIDVPETRSDEPIVGPTNP